MARSISSKLSKALGGKWTYSPACGTWFCDDDKRHVSRVSAGIDWEGEPLPGCEYWLYGGVDCPRRVDQIVSSAPVFTGSL